MEFFVLYVFILIWAGKIWTAMDFKFLYICMQCIYFYVILLSLVRLCKPCLSRGKSLFKHWDFLVHRI